MEIIYYGDNIYTSPDNIIKKTVKPSQTSLVLEMKKHAYSVCRETISENYINNILNPFKSGFKNGFVYLDENNEIIGFIVWTIQKQDPIINMTTSEPPPRASKYMYILLLCAKPTNTTLGYTMLWDAESYCIENAIPAMRLVPATKSLFPYYQKYGFITGQNLPNLVLYKPIVYLIQTPNLKYKTNKTRKRGRKNKPLSENDRKAIEYMNTTIREISDTMDPYLSDKWLRTN
jgi:hypothetical protein